MSFVLHQYRIQAYRAEDGAEFSPDPPPTPDGERGRWNLHKMQPLEPGHVLCSWTFYDDYTVNEQLRNAQETLSAVHGALRQLHPDESDHPYCLEVEGVIARSLVKLGVVSKRTMPQHLNRYVEDMDVPW